MRARWAVVVGALLGALALSLPVSPALAAGPGASETSGPSRATAMSTEAVSDPVSSLPAVRRAATAPVTLGHDYITDEVGALSAAETTALNKRLAELSRAKDVQLFVVFVDAFTAPDNRQQWTEQVARDNGLGKSQYLLAIAVQSRQYYLSADPAGPVPLHRIDAIAASMVNDLHAQDWAAAVGTAADGFQGGSSGGIDVVGIVLIVVGVIAVIIVIAVLIAMRRRAAARIKPVSTEEVHDPLDDISDDELEKRAGSALVRTDDAVTSSAEDLGFATAQFGDASTAVFADVVTRAKAKLDEAFSLKQKLDDEVPDSAAQRREWYLHIIRLCEKADTALNSNVTAFDELRALEQNAEQALAQLEGHRAEADAAVAGAPAALRALQAVYDASVLGTVAENPAQAASRRELADARIADATRLLGEDKRGEAAFAIRTAEEAILQAIQLATAITTLRDDLAAAEGQARALMADLEQDIAGTAALPGSAELDAIVAATRASLDQARTDLTGTGRRPQAVRESLTAANTRIDSAVAQIRSAQQQTERARQVLDQTMTQARAEISTASTYVTTRRGVMGADPRTRLAQASAEYDQAEATRTADPSAALSHAQRAISLARDASSLANSALGQYGDGSAFSGSWGGSGLSDAVIGGLIGGILSGSGRRSSGWGGGSGGWRAHGGGFGASSFGGGRGFGGGSGGGSGGGRSGSGGRF